jgi:hypothetical protein
VPYVSLIQSIALISHVIGTIQGMTYTDSDVPITIRASTFALSDSNLLLTVLCRASPKNVTPGFMTPPQTRSPFCPVRRSHSSSLVPPALSADKRFRLRDAAIRALGSRVALFAEDNGEAAATTGAWQYGTVPLRMLLSISLALTLRLQTQHVAHCNEPWA